jgi:acetoin utilization protein AcuC
VKAPIQKVHIYADDELGAYGYHEKPWYLPGARLTALLDNLSAEGLDSALEFVSAPPATDSDLLLFHSEDHIASVRERCAANEGSLDGAHPRIVQDARRFLCCIHDLSKGDTGALLEPVREALSGQMVSGMNFEKYLGYLQSEGFCETEEQAQTIRLSKKGASFIEEAEPHLAGPTFAREHVEKASTWIAGAVLDATRRILAGEFKKAFIPIAGYHHAHPNEARLYCIYNDPALAIQQALACCQGNIAYVDIDIHQGDGVYQAFSDHGRVYIADLHEDWSTLFPFTPDKPGTGEFPGRRTDRGQGEGLGTVCNIPLDPNTTDTEYINAWNEAESFLRASQPRFVVFESGVDGLEQDPLSNQRLTTAAIAEATRRVAAIADEFADGRLLVLGGGGYQGDGVAKGWTAVVRALLAQEATPLPIG